MRKIPIVIFLVVACAALLRAEEYTLGPDSQRQPNVPKGTLTKYSWTSKIYPATTRDYWIYVPAQYKAEKPACEARRNSRPEGALAKRSAQSCSGQRRLAKHLLGCPVAEMAAVSAL